MSFIVGKKLKMTQIWKEVDVKVVKDKKVVTVKVLKVLPVTVIQAEPNTVSLLRTKKRDGYEAVQVSMGKTKKEFRSKTANPVDVSKFAMGDAVTVEAFTEGDKVRISGISKGKGFQGVVKRYNFRGGPQTHGQKNRLRHAGSIGSTAFQRVVPGRRMAGHMGMDRVTFKNLTVALVDKEKNQIFLKGAVPGMRGTMVEIRK
jgi:large subunit ribosomal protein L3